MNRYFKEKLRREDVLYTFSGVRPLFDDGKGNPSAVTRDYVFDLDETGGPPLLNVFGGKITTFRELGERGLHRLKHVFPHMGGDWTEGAPLPGGEIPNADFETFLGALRETHPWMPRALVHHYGRLYGARTKDVIGDRDTARRSRPASWAGNFMKRRFAISSPRNGRRRRPTFCGDGPSTTCT